MPPLRRVRTLRGEMEDSERKQVEARLDARFEELKRARIGLHRDDDSGRDNELAHIDQHPADMATEVHDEELEETEEIYFEEEERRIAEAREALSAGTYGTCKNCGRKIPPERLAAVPEAVRCIDCQNRQEGLHRQRTKA